MKSINILYEGKESVMHMINEGVLKRDLPYFIQIITASEGPVQAVEIARFVQSSFPNATIMGFTSAGLIYNGTPRADGTLLLVKQYENTQVFQACFSWDDKCAAEVAAEVDDAIADKPARLMHIVCGDHYYDVNDFVEEFNRRNDRTALVGGIAGDVISKNLPGFVFTPEGVKTNSILIAALCGGGFNFYSGVNTSHDPIGGKHKLTKSDGSAWLEINGQPVRQWMFEQLGLEHLENYSDWGTLYANDMLVHFPMILEGYNKASRFLHYDAETDRITQYYSKVPTGTEFRIGYVNPTECLQESFRQCSEIMDQPVEDLFCYSCLFRRLYLKKSSNWELSPYKNVGLYGAFMMGEIAYVDGRNEMLNGSCCLVSVAENDNYIRPDIQVFDTLTAIGEDTTSLLNIVLKHQQDTTTRQNEKLMASLITQQQHQEKQLLVDQNTGVDNYLKYKEDLKTISFDKLCVVKIENADLLTTHLGHVAYLEITRNVLSDARAVVTHLRETEHELINLYVFNEYIFFLAADDRMSESHFTRICKRLHQEKQLYYTDKNEVVVHRFVLCLNQSDPVESALNALAANKNIQDSFLICDDKAMSSSKEEFKMIGVLNRAFEHDGVVPYFQGIYSNTIGHIAYYESLMRIIDIDGTVYAPGQFLGIAQKYHMYSRLSNKMINKVFDLFATLDVAISINISVFDIQSDSTKTMIYTRLKTCKIPHNFVFEILEDEAFQDFAPLKDFIYNVRALGARVAIDDFGTGYSNLYEITTINFDIIKVDGSIIRNLPDNDCNRKLLEVITYMGRLFKAEIVAEFVENQTIQDIVSQTGIEFSQGYLFAKPLPFDQLSLT